MGKYSASDAVQRILLRVRQIIATLMQQIFINPHQFRQTVPFATPASVHHITFRYNVRIGKTLPQSVRIAGCKRHLKM